jgi:hypothetical protein
LQSLGADETIPLTDDTDALDDAFKAQFARGIDIVLDYLWGKSAERLLATAPKVVKEGVPIRFVQIGHSSGANISLPAHSLRSVAIEMTGSGLGSVPLRRIVQVIEEVLQAAVVARFHIALKPTPLAQVERAWNNTAMMPRVVFTMGRT